MTMQLSTAIRNAQANQFEGIIGATAKLQLRTGAKPANCAAANSGTLLAELTLPADWMGAGASGVASLAGSWAGTAVAAGVAGHFRFFDNAGSTCGMQGDVQQQVALVTNALTAVNGNVLNFASTTGVAVGMKVSGTGVLAGTYVVALTGTTVTLSQTSTAGVANGATITFDGDISLNNTTIANGQDVSISAFTYTIPNG